MGADNLIDLVGKTREYAKGLWTGFEDQVIDQQERLNLAERMFYHRYRHYERVDNAIKKYWLQTNLLIHGGNVDSSNDVLKLDEGRQQLTEKLGLSQEMSPENFFLSMRITAWIHDIGNIAEMDKDGVIKWRTTKLQGVAGSDGNGVNRHDILASVADQGEENSKKIAAKWLDHMGASEDVRKVVDYLIECTKFDPKHDEMMADPDNNPCLLAIQFFDQVAQAGEYEDGKEMEAATQGLFAEMRLEGKKVDGVFVNKIAPYFPVLRMLKMFPRTTDDMNVNNHQDRPVIKRLLDIWPKIVALQPDIFKGAKSWRADLGLTHVEGEPDPIYQMPT